MNVQRIEINKLGALWRVRSCHLGNCQLIFSTKYCQQMKMHRNNVLSSSGSGLSQALSGFLSGSGIQSEAGVTFVTLFFFI